MGSGILRMGKGVSIGGYRQNTWMGCDKRVT